MSRDQPDDDQGHRKWPWFLLAALILVAAGGGYWWLSQPAGQTAQDNGPEAPLVRATELRATDTVVLHQTGFVRASDAIDVVPQMSERITEIGPAFAVGERVAEGDLLVRLDATRARATLRSAEARLAQADAALEEARVTLSRQRELAREQVVSQAALDDAQVGFARAQADADVAEAEVEQAALALGDTDLRAPFDAIVTEDRASVGQLVQPGVSIGRLVATDAVEVEMGLLPSDLAVLGRARDAIGLPVTVSDPATGRRLRQGEVTAIVPALDTATRTVGLLVGVGEPFAEDAASLRIGELVDLALEVPLGDSPALRVAAEALKGGDTLWRISDGTLSRHEVRLLSRDGAMATLRAEGIEAGDSILLSDLAAPADGDTVRVATGDPQAAEGN